MKYSVYDSSFTKSHLHSSFWKVVDKKMNTFSFVALTTIVVMFLVSFSSGTNNPIDTGNGYLYKLNATQDVFIHGSSNRNNDDLLIVAKHTGSSKNRILLKFEDLPATCSQIQWAKLYVGYWFSYKPTSMTVQQAPFIVRPLQVHRIMKEWSETEATSVNRKSNDQWSSPFLALDDTDAASHVQDTVTIYTGRPNKQYIEFDITEAYQQWKSGENNYGVLIRATNENQDGRDVRFFTRERDTGKPFVNVLCNYNNY